MVEKVVIRNKKKSPVRYINELKSFKNGREFHFHRGVNIIVGKNGSGKTTLMKLIEAYLLIDKTECNLGLFNKNINKLYAGLDSVFLDGVDVYADYDKNTFRLCHKSEKDSNSIMESAERFNEFFTQARSSTGEGVVVAINALFSYMFGKNAKLSFDYQGICKQRSDYGKYVDAHRVKGDEWTILMDEPDRNLDIDNMAQILDLLGFHKPQTQIIAVVHNPLLIYALAKNKDVNIIEMTKGYVKTIQKLVKEMI